MTTSPYDRPLDNFRSFRRRFDSSAEPERSGWEFTERAIEETDRANGVALDLDDEEPVRGNALLRELAAASEGRMVEVEPGRFYVSKL